MYVYVYVSVSVSVSVRPEPRCARRVLIDIHSTLVFPSPIPHLLKVPPHSRNAGALLGLIQGFGFWEMGPKSEV